MGSFNGIVKSIGIRTTVISDFTGDIHSIPNGSIIGVTNHSRNEIRFAVDVNISYEENIEKTSNTEASENNFFIKSPKYFQSFS